MPNWNEILFEIKAAGSTHDIIRRKYLSELYKITGRNTIIYYSGWLQKPGLRGTEVNDGDKNGFMTVINKMDRSKGLDLILHTPGGETAATESLVDYLRSMFSTDMRAIIPQLALSAGASLRLRSTVCMLRPGKKKQVFIGVPERPQNPTYFYAAIPCMLY